MAINPDDITTVRVDQLADATLTLESLFPHTVGTELKSSTIQELVDLVSVAIGAGSGVGFLAESRTNGQTLPDIPTDPSFMLVGIGTFVNVNGYPDVICTEELNALITVSDHWAIGVEIPINPLSGTVQTVTGSAVDNTDPLNPVINSTGGGGSQDLQLTLENGEDATGSGLSIHFGISDGIVAVSVDSDGDTKSRLDLDDSGVSISAGDDEKSGAVAIDPATGSVQIYQTESASTNKQTLVKILPATAITEISFPAKPAGDYVVAMTSDIIDPADSLTSSITDGDTTHAPTGDAVFGALALKEDLNNKDTNVTLGTSDAKYPSQKAVKTYVDNTVSAATVGLLDDRGNYDASANLFPASGGSGTSGAILKGDLWTVSVAGTLGSNPVTLGDVVRALVDTPGQTSANWAVTENNIGYVAENTANKSTNVDTDKTSNVKYSTPKSIYDWATGLFQTLATFAADVRATILTGFSAAAGTVSASDSILSAINKIVGNIALKADIASPALTGTPTAPTQSANDNSTKIATTAYADSALLLKKDKYLDANVFQGKTIVFFGDSYTSGTGATNNGRRFSTLLANGLGAFESNQGVQGTTIMKRTPVNYINSPNMVDNMVNIPTYSETTHAFLNFEFGLNDMGQNGVNYTTANFITDYQTILTYANGTKGWPFNKILILGSPYANSTGYAAYAVLSGNAAPTTQHHLDFIEAARQVAATNGTMYIDLYQNQVKNGVSTTMNADGYHPNDAGHYAIARIIMNYFGYAGIFEPRVGVSTSNPVKFGLGGSYSNTLGSQANMKFRVYDDGANFAGLGHSSTTQEYHVYSGGKHNIYINDVLIQSIPATGPATTLKTTTGSLKTAYVAKTTTYTIGTNDYTVNCTSGTFTVTLPSAVTVGAGTLYVISNSGAGTITIGTTSSQTFANVTATPTTLTMATVGARTVQSDGANWLLISSL